MPSWTYFRHTMEGLDRIQVGDDIIVLTWLHLSHREVLKLHPRGDASRPLTGVFSTRSPDRPNPAGLHRSAPPSNLDVGFTREHYAGFGQFFVVFSHLSEELLARKGARL